MFRSLAAAAALLMLAACGGPAKPGAPVTGDAFLGPANATVVLTEFAAPTCPVCKGWHDEVFAKVKSAYIDTGKIKFVLRELPSHNPPVDVAIFSIARCSGAENFFKVIDDAFANQAQIEIASRGAAGARSELAKLAAKYGIDAKAFEACIRDPANAERIESVRLDADKRGVHGTPTLFLNDQPVSENNYSFEGLSGVIDAALASASPAPAATPSP